MSKWTTQYDNAIRAASRQFLPLWDWNWLKAQLCAESELNPDAVSPAGAQGIAQFMPATAEDVFPSAGLGEAAPFDPLLSIKAAAFYMSRIRGWWHTPRPESDRRALTQASYNAGFGNISHAQMLSHGATTYDGIIRFLPCVTGDKSKETIDYVARIARYYAELVGTQGSA